MSSFSSLLLSLPLLFLLLLPLSPSPSTSPSFHVVRLSPSLDSLLLPNAHVEILATGFRWLEGPVWHKDRLLFSDTCLNAIFSWRELEGTTVFLQPIFRPSSSSSSSSSSSRRNWLEPGSNGIALVHDRMLVAEHGNRWISSLNLTTLDAQSPAEKALRTWRWARQGFTNVVASSFEGKKLNSPNDLVFSKKGILYFSDPPFGLQDDEFRDERGNLDQHPHKEQQANGVYLVRRPHTAQASVEVFERGLSRPNGVGLSPDESLLYVSNSDFSNHVLRVYKIDPATGVPSQGRVFFDFSKQEGPGRVDGFDIDAAGNVYTSGPGGVYVINKEGELLGKIDLGRKTSNCALGGGHLYITSQDMLLRIPLSSVWGFEEGMTKTRSAQ